MATRERIFKLELPNGEELAICAKANVTTGWEGDPSIPNGTRDITYVEDIIIPEAEQKRIIKEILESLEDHDNWTEE